MTAGPYRSIEVETKLLMERDDLRDELEQVRGELSRTRAENDALLERWASAPRRAARGDVLRFFALLGVLAVEIVAVSHGAGRLVVFVASAGVALRALEEESR